MYIYVYICIYMYIYIQYIYIIKTNLKYIEYIEGKLKDYLSTCDHYSLALDESTDQGDTAQLVIFIRGIDENLNVTEEMLDLCHMKGTTTGRDIYEYVDLALEKFNVDRRTIYSITTDGAPALTGKNNGFVALFKQSVDHEILNNHCLIHQQQLCAQKLNMKHLMTRFESSRVQRILGRSWK